MDLKDVIATWILAGFIVTIIFLALALAGGFSSFFSELVIDAAFGMIPFPFDLIVTWSMNPFPVIMQVILTVILLFWESKN